MSTVLLVVGAFMLGMLLGRRYIEFDGTLDQLWREARRHAPLSYRLFGRSVPIEKLDAELASMPDGQRFDSGSNRAT